MQHETDIARLMRTFGVTIRELSTRMNVPMTAIRAVRADSSSLSEFGRMDYWQAITGRDLTPAMKEYLAIWRARS